MKIILFNLLTLLLFLGAPSQAFSSFASQEKHKKYLRWKLSTVKNHVSVKKEKDMVLLQTSNSNLFKQLKADIKNFVRDEQYMKRIEFDPPGKNDGVYSILIQLQGNIELFAFYRDREQEHIIDFWKEVGEVADRSPSSLEIKPTPKKKKFAPVKKKAVVKRRPPVVKNVPVVEQYRDFRYGGAFYWDYEPLEIPFDSIIDLRSKTPEFFYPIEDRNYRKSDKEAHLQLSINMYRKRKWGLMYNSIKLYREKYGEEDDNTEINEYLKANAIIRDNFKKQKKGPTKTALNILENIEKRSSNYALRKGIIKYALQYSIDKKDYVAALKAAKNLYMETSKKNDVGDARLAAKAILFNLSKLNQIDSIQKILKKKDMNKYLTKNTILMYEIYSYLKIGKNKDVINIYKREKSNFAKPIHKSILFNVAEAAFRESKFSLATKMFDDFIANYSYHTFSSHSRVRLALIYDLTKKPLKEVILLYDNAINRSQDIKASLEARIRYVGVTNLRKIEIEQKDRESRVLLDMDAKERENLDLNLKKILWLVRTRILIVDGQYKDALAYLETIPLESLKPVEKRVFEGEGAEIFYGVISNLYRDSKYSEIIKFWNTYKDKYVLRVANDSIMNFIVGKSYLKLGLYDEFDRVYEKFLKIKDEPERNFPFWVKRRKNITNSDITHELVIEKNLALENVVLAQRELDILKNKNNSNDKINYYQGLIFYAEKNYKKTSEEFENFLIRKNRKNILSPEETGLLLTYYTDSLYKQGSMDKFKRVSRAILKDTEQYGSEHEAIKKLKERLHYMVIEVDFSDSKSKNHARLGDEILKFKKHYKNSLYLGRVNYILGRYYVKSNKRKKAREIFNSILSDKDVSKNVKGLVKAELAMMSIQEKKI